MRTACHELMFFLLAALVGGLLLRQVFLAERPPTLQIAGFMEAQHLQIAPESDLQAPVLQDTARLSPSNFTGENFAWYPSNREGQTIIFQLNDVEPGLYTLALYLAPGGDFGIFTAALNGETLIEQVDLHVSALAHRTPFQFEDVSLQEDNTLSFTVLGHNAATSAPHYQFGFDGLTLHRRTAE